MRRHELDPVSLVFGFAITATGALFLAGRLDQAVRLRWLWPVLLLALGLGVLLDLNTRRPKAPAEPTAALDEAEPVEAEAAETPEAEPAPTAGLEPEEPPPPDRDR
jgi:hypothetical protein